MSDDDESDLYHAWSSLWNNITEDADGDSNGSNSGDYFDGMNLQKAEDVSVKTVLTSVIFNTVLFLMLMAIYELLRHQMPAVYSHRKKRYMSGSGKLRQQKFKQQQQQREVPTSSQDSDSIAPDQLFEDSDDSISIQHADSMMSDSSLPEIDKPLDWLGPVLGVSWKMVRRTAGLDGYFFLRFIRMNVRICAVTMVWFLLILVPLYGTGNEDNVTGWYKYSAKNLPKHGGWKMWIACVFLYLFSGFIVFVIKQEYRHFLEVRQDFLARGSAHVNPQHHYSIQIENIPYELRSERALAEYFENLFPGKVHSASVVLKVPDVEAASAKCQRSCQRLEKAIAIYQATGERPVHIVGRGRISVLGVELISLECATPACCRCDDEEMADYYRGMDEDDDNDVPDRPPKGTRVDTISYYTQELAGHSRALARLQKRKNSLAETGNHSLQAGGWLDKIVKEATLIGNAIMRDSMQDNHLESSSANLNHRNRKNSYPQAENMTSQYGSIAPPKSAYFKNDNSQDIRKSREGIPVRQLRQSSMWYRISHHVFWNSSRMVMILTTTTWHHFRARNTTAELAAGPVAWAWTIWLVL
jgi:Late exocytosis, associated with Golgi transport/Cytosolic domain of 10TM putative phosphate transporter